MRVRVLRVLWCHSQAHAWHDTAQHQAWVYFAYPERRHVLAHLKQGQRRSPAGNGQAGLK